MSLSGAIVVVGNLTSDPELRFTPNGVAVVTVNVAKNKRIFNKVTQEWEDGGASYFRGTVWRDQAENVASSLSKGDSVVVIGEIEQENYETKEGEKRTSFKINIEEIAPSLRFATAVVTKNNRGGGRSSAPAQAQQAQQARPAPSTDDNPWNSGPLDDSTPPF